jgi:hypothetical protein
MGLFWGFETVEIVENCMWRCRRIRLQFTGSLTCKIFGKSVCLSVNCDATKGDCAKASIIV